jgi:hypothetical protein
MAIKKYLVVGMNAINGVPTGGEIELDPDDETPGAINVAALVMGGSIMEMTDSPDPARVHGDNRPTAKRHAKKADDGGDE